MSLSLLPSLEKKPNVYLDAKNYFQFLGNLSVGDSYNIHDIATINSGSVPNHHCF